MAEIETKCEGFKKARPAANETASSFPSRIPTATEPTGDGVIPMRPQNSGGSSANGLNIVPYGTGADTNTFKMRVIGWRRVQDTSNSDKTLWIPVLLGEFTCTMTTAVGVAGKAVVATERFCDTITVDKGNSGVSIDAVSPANDTIASIRLDAVGSQYVELTFNTNSSATDMNALYSKF